MITEHKARKMFRNICGEAMEARNQPRNIPVFHIDSPPHERDYFENRGSDSIACTWFSYKGHETTIDDIEYGAPALRVSFNPVFYSLMDDDEIESILRHEIGHVIVGIHAGHGWEWEGMSKELNFVPEPSFLIRKWRDLPPLLSNRIFAWVGDNAKPTLDLQNFTSETLTYGKRVAIL